MDIRDATQISDSDGYRFLGMNDDNLVSITSDDLIISSQAYEQMQNDIATLQEQLGTVNSILETLIG